MAAPERPIVFTIDPPPGLRFGRVSTRLARAVVPWLVRKRLHRFPDTEGFGQRVQEAELEYLVSSRAASTALAENYVGLPL